MNLMLSRKNQFAALQTVPVSQIAITNVQNAQDTVHVALIEHRLPQRPEESATVYNPATPCHSHFECTSSRT